MFVNWWDCFDLTKRKTMILHNTRNKTSYEQIRMRMAAYFELIFLFLGTGRKENTVQQNVRTNKKDKIKCLPFCMLFCLEQKREKLSGFFRIKKETKKLQQKIDKKY